MAKISASDIDKLRMPEPNFGDPRGRVDRDVLRAASWGTDYDIDARRNAIAGAMAGPAPGGGGISPEQAYINAIGFPGTLDQFYASRGMTGAQGAPGAPGASGMPTGGGISPEQAYLNAIGYPGTLDQFYAGLGGGGGGGAPAPTGITPAPQLLPQGSGGTGFGAPMATGGGFVGADGVFRSVPWPGADMSFNDTYAGVSGGAAGGGAGLSGPGS